MLLLNKKPLPKYSPTLNGVKAPAANPWNNENKTIFFSSIFKIDLQVIFHFQYCKKIFGINKTNPSKIK
jgi:hypothetical protein